MKIEFWTMVMWVLCAVVGAVLWDLVKVLRPWFSAPPRQSRRAAPKEPLEAKIRAELDRHDWVSGGDGRYAGGAVWAGHEDAFPSEHLLVIYTHDKKFILWPLGLSYSCTRVIGVGLGGESISASSFSQEQLVRALAGCTFVGSIQHSEEARRLCAEAFAPRLPAAHAPLKLPADRQASIERAIEVDDGACSTVPPPPMKTNGGAS